MGSIPTEVHLPILATIRLRPMPAGGDQSDKARADEASLRLQEHGFDILYVGDGTVDVEVSERDFERAFGVRCPGEQGMSAGVCPTDNQLRELVELVEGYPPAVYCSQGR